MRTLRLIVLSVIGVVAASLLIADRAWRRATESLASRLRRPQPRGRFRTADIERLPAPVRRYFSVALRDGQPLYAHARLTQEGTFLTKPETGGWSPFTATHEIAVDPPGFVWDARMRIAPGVSVRVRDSIVDGRGSMRASAMGLVNVMNAEGDGDLAAGALMRYLAEGAWCPTALLPSAGVEWTPIDDSSARATITSGAATVSLDFHFGADGLIESTWSPSRGREVGGKFIPTPWAGRWSRYVERDGMRVPAVGEVAWLLPDQPQPYWRGRMTNIEFD